MDSLRNTHCADVNELALTYYLNGECWPSDADELHFLSKLPLIGVEERRRHLTRAHLMADAIHAFIAKHYYMDVKRALWVSRPNVLSKVLDKPIAWRNNPTDVLVQMTNGFYVGFSVKSTSQFNGAIGFKNPGLSTIERSLGVSYSAHIFTWFDEMYDTFPDMPRQTAKRKAYIRQPEHAGIAVVTRHLGECALENIRMSYHASLSHLSSQAMYDHLTQVWYDVKLKEQPFDYYKITAVGEDQSTLVRIEDPVALDFTPRSRFEFESLGKFTIGVMADSQRLLRLRIKFTSEKLASSIKFSAERWTL